MEKYSGFQSKPIHKTNNIILRWFVNNITHPISYHFFGKAMSIYVKYETHFDIYPKFKMPRPHDRKYRFNLFLYKILNLPYERYGTTYKIDLSDLSWLDQDDFGVAYWQYEWNEDPLTGDAWRVIKK